MEETRQTVNKILAEIEQDNMMPEERELEYRGKTAAEVVNIFLGTKQEANKRRAGISAYAFDMEELNYWREKNNQIFEIHYYHPIYSYKKFIGPCIVTIKKLFRKLMKSVLLPVIMEQNEFNASVTASINALYNNEIITKEFIQTQETNNHKIVQLQEEITALKKQVSELIEEKTETYDQLKYGKFEDYFRGSSEVIKERQKMYLPYFHKCSHVIDLGCGRGEFLELLSENDIYAVGVDLNKEFVKDCVSKGLSAIQEDAVSYIQGLKNESVDGIFTAQLVEHLKTDELIQLCIESYQKLMVGGYLIIETPNPTCLSIFCNAFYVDPTHNKPVHPKTLEYFLNIAGFKQVEILFTEGSKVGYRLPLLEAEGVQNLREFNDGLNCLSDLIFGSQDYAIIAQK